MKKNKNWKNKVSYLNIVIGNKNKIGTQQNKNSSELCHQKLII